MENKVVNLEVKDNLSGVTKDIKKLAKSFEDTSDEIQGIKKSSKNASDGVNSLATGFRFLGLAIKAIGIGLVLEAFNLFKEVLGQNQKVVDLFSTGIGALKIAFNDLTGFITDKFPSIIKIFKDVFENPTTYLKKFGDLVQENLIERFNSFLDTIGFLSDALKKVFEGDFIGALDSVKKAGKESIDILTGVNDSFDKGKKFIEEASDSILNYAANTLKSAAANVELQKSALIAAAQQALLVEKYDIQAEQLRKIRDNDLISISERIIANDKLKNVLENQEAALKAQAALQLQAAQATFNLNKNTENEIALINARANALGVVAQVLGISSEQEANRVALQKESVELTQSQIDAETELGVEKKKFNETLEIDDLRRLEIQKTNLQNELIIELDGIERKRELYALGTQARVDAETTYAAKKQEIDNAIIANEKEQNLKRIEDEKAVAEARNAILNSQLNNASAAIELAKGLFEKNKVIQKAALIAESAVGIAKIIINTQAANAAATLKYALLPGGQALSAAEIVANKISAGIGIASNVAATAKGLSSLGGGSAAGGNVGGGGPRGASSPAAPQFNIIGASPVNQLAQSLGEKQNVPIKAYVVSGEVSTAQALDRNIIKSATLG
jgi:hypothetical protein